MLKNSALIVLTVLVMGSGCADMHAGKRWAVTDDFDGSTRAGVALGSIGDAFGNDVWIDSLALEQRSRSGLGSGTIVLKGTIRTSIPFFFDAMQVKADDDTPISLSGKVVHSFIVSPNYYDSFVANLTQREVARLAEADTIAMRASGRRLRSNDYELTPKQLAAIREFYHVIVLGKSDAEYEQIEAAIVVPSK